MRKRLGYRPSLTSLNTRLLLQGEDFGFPDIHGRKKRRNKRNQGNRDERCSEDSRAR